MRLKCLCGDKSPGHESVVERRTATENNSQHDLSMGQVFDLAGHGTLEYEQRGFETAVKKEFGTEQKPKKGQIGLQIEARVVVTIYEMDGLLR